MMEKIVLQEAANRTHIPIPNGSIALSTIFVCAVVFTLFYVSKLMLKTAFRQKLNAA